MPGPADLPLPGIAPGHLGFIFTALGTGSRLVLVDEAQRLDLPSLVELIRSHDVQRLFLPVAEGGRA